MRNILSAIPIVLCCISCKSYLGPDHELEWYLKNNTSQEVYCIPHNFYEDEPDIEYLSPGDSILLARDERPVIQGISYFDTFWSDYGTETDFRIYSADGTLLKEWKGENYNKPGRQFFRERHWRHYFRMQIDPYGIVWVFDLLPEDIEADGQVN